MAAKISDCGKYRYWLTREVSGQGRTTVVMVNPSTADATTDDATIRKLKGFGERHQWGQIVVVNLFAYRATDVKELGRVTDPVGPMTDAYLEELMKNTMRVVLAWGSLSKMPKDLRYRAQQVRDLALKTGTPVYHLGNLTKCNQPQHPLMLAYETPLNRYALTQDQPRMETE